MKRTLLAVTVILSAHPVLAQGVIAQTPAYKECTALAGTDPARALEKAEAWITNENGVASQHCKAMALFGLRQFKEAADTLSAVREAIARDNITLRSYLAQQASKAWVSANLTDKALSILTNQINEISSIRGDNVAAARITADLLLERARLHVASGKLTDATKDLDHAVSLTPINEDVLLERANVFDKLGDKALARNDAEIVLKLNSKNAKAKAFLRDSATLSGAKKI